jgi:hypothetical protein
MIEAVRRVVAAVRVPVTADVEGGYGSGTPDDVEDTCASQCGSSTSVRGVIFGRDGTSWGPRRASRRRRRWRMRW